MTGKKSWLLGLIVPLISLAFLLGIVYGNISPLTPEEAEKDERPAYSSGWYPASFYAGAYQKAKGEKVPEATSGLVAHHLLVANKIAEVFENLASDEVKTVVLVGPNHFKRGVSLAQVSKREWNTPFGDVVADDEAIDRLLSALPFLHHEETAYKSEHGIYGLMPFIATSFPNAKVVPIILQEDLSAERAWEIGQTIAQTLPDAVLFASVDMTHNRDAEFTAYNDARVLDLLHDAGMCDGTLCITDLVIDSNTSLRVLFGFNAERGTTQWQMTHHGSSLEMGATKNWLENTSHILGYFLPAK